MAFEELKAASKSLIDANGVSAVLKRDTLSSNDPDKPWVKSNSESQYNCKIVVLPSGRASGSDLSGDIVEEYPDVIYISPDLSTEPRVDDLVITSGITFTIKKVQIYAPNVSDKLLYVCGVIR